MRAGLVRIAVALAAAIALAACGSSSPDSSGDNTPSPAPPATSAAVPSPTSTSADFQARFCADLNAFSAAAGGSFDIGALALIDGETPNERRTVSQLVDSMVSLGARLQPELPADLADDIQVVVRAAGEAKRRLADGKPAQEAVDLLTAKAPKAARETVVAYRNSC